MEDRTKEFEAIRRAFGKKDLPQHEGVKIGGGEFKLTAAQRRAYQKKKLAAQARADAIGRTD